MVNKVDIKRQMIKHYVLSFRWSNTLKYHCLLNTYLVLPFRCLCFTCRNQCAVTTCALLKSNQRSCISPHYTSFMEHVRGGICVLLRTSISYIYVCLQYVQMHAHTHSLTWASCLMCVPNREWNCSFVREKEKDGGSGCLLHAMFSLWN